LRILQLPKKALVWKATSAAGPPKGAAPPPVLPLHRVATALPPLKHSIPPRRRPSAIDSFIVGPMRSPGKRWLWSNYRAGEMTAPFFFWIGEKADARIKSAPRRRMRECISSRAAPGSIERWSPSAIHWIAAVSLPLEMEVSPHVKETPSGRSFHQISHHQMDFSTRLPPRCPACHQTREAPLRGPKGQTGLTCQWDSKRGSDYTHKRPPAKSTSHTKQQHFAAIVAAFLWLVPRQTSAFTFLREMAWPARGSKVRVRVALFVLRTLFSFSSFFTTRGQDHTHALWPRPAPRHCSHGCYGGLWDSGGEDRRRPQLFKA